MSIAKKLAEVDPNFIEPCPLCKRPNRMVVKGVFTSGETRECYPDMGYYFCNCKNVFYTRFKNLTNDIGFQSLQHPLEDLKNKFNKMKSGEVLNIIAPDIFFVDWQQDPYEFVHWNPRTTYTLWNMNQIVEEAKVIGFEVVKAEHNFDTDSENPQTFNILLRRASSNK